MYDVFLKKSDVLPVLQTTISGAAGVIDLSDVTGAYLAYRLQGTGSATISSGVIVSATSGLVEFTWTTGITLTVGTYYAEWRLLYATNRQRSYPQDSFITFHVISGLI